MERQELEGEKVIKCEGEATRLRSQEAQKGTNLSQTCVGDTIPNVERVASGTCDFANVMSHEEIGAKCVVDPTNNGRVRLALVIK